MEHWLVALRSGWNDAALDWAARHADGRAALEVIASGLDLADPHGAVERAAGRLQAAHAPMPRALHMVPRSLLEELGREAPVDLIVLGARGGLLDRVETDRILALLGACRSPVVLVPRTEADGIGDASEPRPFDWPLGSRRPPAELRATVRAGRDAVRVVRSASAAGTSGPRLLRPSA